MPIGTTYKETIKKNGRTFKFVGRSYGLTAIQGGSGPAVLKDEATRLHKQGFDTVLVKKKDVNDYIFYLYSAPKVKKSKKGRK